MKPIMQKLGLLIAMLCATLAASAYDFTVDGIYYNITDAEKKTVEVTFMYYDNYGDYECHSDYSGSVVIPSTVVYSEIPYSVTSIGICAFWNCSDMTSVTIPNSVTSIGGRAFGDCSGLTSVTIPNSVTSLDDSVFDCCSSLTSVTIPNSVISIGRDAFRYCSSLTSITIPNSVTSIGSQAFYECRSLISVNVMAIEPPSISAYTFDTTNQTMTLSIPKKALYFYLASPWAKFKNVQFIDSEAFLRNYSDGILNYSLLEAEDEAENNLAIVVNGKYDAAEVIIPENLTVNGSYQYEIVGIGYAAFRGCNKLKNVNFGNNSKVTFLGDEAFQDAGITEITFPLQINSIGKQSFYNCKYLTSITISNFVTSIEYGTFAGCSGLTSVTIPSSVTSIGDGAFNSCSGLTSVTIPNSVTSIGDGAFNSCSSLTSFTIPHSVTSIGDYVFGGCSSLTSVVIPNSVTSIGEGAFSFCSKLTSVIIPNSVTTIGDQAFLCCSSLKKSAYPNTLPNPFGYGIRIAYNPDGALYEDGFIYGPNKSSIIFAPINLTGEYLMPNSVTKIGESAFAECSKLSSIVISNSVDSIAGNTFANCNLTKVVFPPSIQSIGNSAFTGNNWLEVVIMGHQVKTIKEKAFDHSYIKNVFITAQEPPAAPYSAFNRYSGKLFVQGASTVATYKNAIGCWDRFAGYAMSEPAGMTFEGPEKVEGVAGEQFTLKAMLVPADVDLPYVFWRSTDPTKAYVDHKGVVTILEDVCEGDDWKIIAETLYANGPTAEFAINAAMNGVEAVEAEEAAALEGLVDVYNLQGAALLRNASAEEVNALKAGIYIVRSGSRTAKVAVK